MKNPSPSLLAHIQGEATTLATCWKLTLRNSTFQGFTDHDRPLVIDGVTYSPESGSTPSAIQSSTDLAVDNLAIEGVLNSDAIPEADILAGLYDFAEIELFLVNHQDVTQGTLHLRRGWLGEVTLGRSGFTAEVRGLTQRLSRTLGALYSPACRANLGDARCGVDLGPFTFTGSVTGAADRRTFSDTSRTEAAGFFDSGVVTFTSGANETLSMEVKEYTPGSITLALPMPYAIAPGDGYSIAAGCDKTFTTCKARFDNVLNFRGEPHVPGTDRILQTVGR